MFQSINNRYNLITLAACSLVALLAMNTRFSLAQETDVWIATKSGEMIKGKTVQQFVPWNNVSEKGEITQSKIPIDSKNNAGVKRLILTGQPASAAIARVRKLVLLLTSDVYTERHAAETELIETGGAYQDIIRSVPLPDDAETQIRLQRIKDTLSMRTSENVKTEFDFCWTNENRKLLGDVGDWKLVAEIRGQRIECDRTKIDAIYFSDPASGATRHQKQFEKFASFYQLENGFQNDKQLMVTFETDINGLNIPSDTDTDVTDSFRHLGCIFECEGDPANHVIISNFSMKGSVSNKNSVCNFRPEQDTKRKFYGEMRIRFVDPKYPNIPATIHEIGLFMAVVSPRQSVIEAYNVDGYRIGKVESTKINSFVGIHSPEPIAYLRVLANPDYVVPDDINADENFAIDDVCLSAPVASDQVAVGNQVNVVLRDGQRWLCSKLEFNGQQIILRDTNTLGPEVEIGRSEIRSIIFRNSTDHSKASAGNVLGMLSDGSVVFVEPGEKFKLANFDQMELETPALLGYWGSEQVVRYPESSDFENDKVVVALPNARAIAPSFVLTSDRCEIDLDAVQVVVPPAELEQVRVPGDIDPVKSLQYSNSPCVWFAEPATIDDKLGLVRLKDGRRFVLDTESGFALSGLTNEMVSISRGGKSLDIPIQDVRSIRFSE